MIPPLEAALYRKRLALALQKPKKKQQFELGDYHRISLIFFAQLLSFAGLNYKN